MEQLHIIYRNIERNQAYIWGFPCSAVVKNLPANVGDTELWVQTPGWEDPQ